MNIGFTGTREGMSLIQRQVLDREFLSLMHTFPKWWLHHGDCRGADEQAHAIAKECGAIVIVHPPMNEAMRARCKGDFVHKPLPYMERNHKIVQQSRRLIACPKGPELQRSGTWATVRYAKKLGKQVLIITPDGNTILEN